MKRITFRTDAELAEILARATKKTGLTPSEIIRLALTEYVADAEPMALIKANIKRRAAK